MADSEAPRMKRRLGRDLVDLKVRLSRYRKDPLLAECVTRPGSADLACLRQKSNVAWGEWCVARKMWLDQTDKLDMGQLNALEEKLLEIERRADELQRELVCPESARAGWKVVACLAAAQTALLGLYVVAHGMADDWTFEVPLMWGPGKYVEVFFWTCFGSLTGLLGLAGTYLARRDFDRAYSPWYLTSAVRAPFLATVLMFVIVELGEAYGSAQGLFEEEGAKFYGVALLSFCMGMVSEQTGMLVWSLAEGVLTFVQGVVQRFSDRLASVFVTRDVASR